MQLQCTGRYIHIIVMKMMIKGVQTANCNPILESRQKRQLQRTIDTNSKILHFWRKGGGLQKGHLSHVKMLQSASKIHLLNSYNLSSQVICESAVFFLIWSWTSPHWTGWPEKAFARKVISWKLQMGWDGLRKKQWRQGISMHSDN